MGSMQSDVHWPFPNGTFPDGLLVIVQKTVAAGALPALVVIHDDEDDWLLCDGINDPNSSDASMVSHMDHVLERDPSLASLAGLPPGHVAQRGGRDEPWSIGPWEYEDDSSEA